MDIIKSVIEKQREVLIKNAKKLKVFETLNPIKKVISVKEEFKEKILGTNIYIIKTKYSDKGKITKAFNDASKLDIKLASLNMASDFNGILYVGVSNSLQKRINQHLGFCSEKVYALHLKKWFHFKDNNIEIEIYPVPTNYAELSIIIENGLWDYYKPLFGKKGTNVKKSITL